VTLKDLYGEPVDEAMFCFLFTKLSYDALKARFPAWVQVEGNVGPNIMSVPVGPMCPHDVVSNDGSCLQDHSGWPDPATKETRQ
jgi:hypothetical protein